MRPRAVPTGSLRRRESLSGEPEPVRHLVDGILEPGRRAHDEFRRDSPRPREGCRPRLPQPGADALESVAMRLQRIGSRVEHGSQACLVVCVRAHASRSRTARNACMALAVWLFTAPRLIRMASAIWASDISA
jgi:hypothetical protein